MSLIIKKRKELDCSIKQQVVDRSDVAAAAAALTCLVKPARGGNGTTTKGSFVQLAFATDDSKKEMISEEDIDDENEEEQDEDEGESSNEFTIPQKFTKSGRKRAVPFPIKLMKVLSCKEYEHIICWTPSGKAFSIEKPKLFTAEILPLHFKTAKYSSFTRKLHRWGFMRHYRGAEAGSFFHNDFLRGRLDLVEKMSCCNKAELPSKAAVGCTKLPNCSETENTELNTTVSSNAERTNPSQLQHIGEVQAMPALQINAEALPAAIQNVLPTAAEIQMQRRLSLPANIKPNFDAAANQYLLQNIEGTSFDLQSRIQAVTRSTYQETAAPVSTLTGQLNAAIEAEVSRRLNERINQVAMTKHALEILQQAKPLLVPAPTKPRLPGLPLLGWNQPQLRNPSELLLQQQLRNRETQLSSHGLPNLASPNAFSLAALQNFYKQPSFNYAQRVQASNLSSLPPTNIQGAKTA